jgi:protein-disulfide isomerase
MASKKSPTIGGTIYRISKVNTTHILVVLLIIAAFFTGVLFTRVQYLEKDIVQNTAAAPQETAAQKPQQPTGYVDVSLDNDAVLGDPNALVTLVEFVDYECPFCKRFADETLPQIKSEYIDTGKVKLVMRDLPLSFHQNAHVESQAAECAREQGGDSSYFQYHDEIFKRTISNGTGLALDQLAVIANDIGLNGSILQSCLDLEKYKAEVDKDISDAAVAGATGTPSFFIGKSDNSGTIKGTIVVGAHPFESFKVALDTALNEN